MELHLVIFGLCLLANGARASSDLKSSLAFVIADTETMDEEIEEITKNIDAIVHSVANSTSSPIEEYVLVTFDDEVKLATKTNDSAILKEKLSDINTGGGGFCPVKALTGIELALNESKDGSLIYVFSDASAEDFNQSAKIEALCQKKGIQVVFILTGVCDGNKASEDYLVYEKIARATNGQVFHLKESEIGEILKYVEESIKSRKNILASKTLKKQDSFDVKVDGDTNELVIAVSGENPSIRVISNGKEVPTTNITKLQDIVVVKASVEPGVYKVSVDSKSETHVVVSASTSVHFQHGFSTITPSAITDTVRRPVPPSYAVKGETKSYLSIQLGPGGSKVHLQSVKIFYMDDTVYLDIPLKPVNKDHFYVTEPIVVPEEMFKIAINGYDTTKAISVTRYSLTPVKQQPPTAEAIEKEPVIIIDGAPVVKADFYKPLQLKCRVSAWPKPDVVWEYNYTSLEMDDLAVVELPYDYVRVLNIPKVTKNATYTCSAVNAVGKRQTLEVAVETVKAEFIEVKVEDTSIEYKQPGEIICNVLAYPSAKISWYKQGLGKKPLESNKDWTISADGSTISIKSMEPKLAGSYYCLAKNPVSQKVKPAKVKCSGIGRPKIDKSTYQIRVKEGQNTSIICKVDATPNATISWTFKNATTFIQLNGTTNTTTLNNTARIDAGTYTCRAKNRYGIDYHGFEVIVEYKPTILKNLTESGKVQAIEGLTVILNCSVDGVPAPNITWVHNYKQIDNIDNGKYIFFTNGSLGFLAQQNDTGKYTCIADNGLGIGASSLHLDVILPVAIQAPKNSYIEQEEGTELMLHCIADGTPQPNITWLYYEANSKEYVVVPHNDATKDVVIKKIQHGQSGEYTCVAANAGGSKNITYFVSVTARPTILNTQKEFKGVLDDYFLRVPCEAIGNPKPYIIWSNATDFLLASDTDWYLIGDDGSLIIKNLSKEQEGLYNCTAINKYGSDSKIFTVRVDEYPTDNFLAILIEQGKPINVPCSVPHKNLTDRIRWFKDGHSIPTPVLENVTAADAGNYTCRVSSVDRSAMSGTTRLDVGAKPKFTSEARNITFFYYDTADLDCTTTGLPTPTVTWFHDGREISGFTGSRYRFVMDSEDKKGRYTCIVKNQFNQYGDDQKNFYIISEW